MHHWLLTTELTEEEQKIPLDEWLQIICDFVYERDIKNFWKQNAKIMQQKREKFIQIWKKIAQDKKIEFNRADFKFVNMHSNI